jgi:hypothetical protein
MRRLFSLIVFVLAFAGIAQGATYAAASCNFNDVQTAFNNEAASPANGDIIVIPSCPAGANWGTNSISENTNVTLTVQGSTTISTNCAAPPTHTNACTATDNTVLTGSGGNPLIGVFASGSGILVRFTGITFNANSNAYYNGILATGANSASQIRIDHCHFENPVSVMALIYQPAPGVIDHNIVDSSGTYNGFKLYGNDGVGYVQWNQATQFGTANFTFIENNTFNNGFGNDCNAGGRYVMRYNVWHDTGNAEFAQGHAVGSSLNPPLLGCRAWEVYGNYLAENWSHGGNGFAAEFHTSGTGLSWNNTVTGLNYVFDMVSDRDDGSTNYGQNAPPNGWGYCASVPYMGVVGPSPWDGNHNANGSAGSPCLSQPGRGQGDLLSGSAFPTICDQTLGCSTYGGQWPNQKLEPIYSWEESLTGGLSIALAQSPNGNIVQNRDYFVQVGGTQTSPTSPFNGTTGTGYGPTADIPTTCTAGPGGTYGTSPTGSYGVLYFDTTAQKAYVCSSTNTWTLMYQPYTYPHPLVGGGTPQASPPTASPTSGVVPQTVTVTNPNSGTTVVCYATNSTIPATNGLGTGCTTGTQYTTPLTISSAETLNLIAGVASDTDSTVVSYTYTAAAVAPTVTTTAATSVTATTASAGGTVTSNGGSSVTAEGVACGLTVNPVVGSSCSVASGGTATPFTVSLTGLTASTTYHIRGYATNPVGTGYGSDQTFTTLSSCASPVAIGLYTLCNQSAAALPGSGTVVSTNISPFGGNGVEVFAFTCANSSSCATAPTQTAVLSDNLNNPETNCTQAPNSPYSSLDTTIPDQVKLWAWYCPSIPLGVTSFTVTLSGTGFYPQISVMEWKAGSIASTGYFESVDAVGFVTTGTSISVAPSGPTVHANDLITGMTQTCGGNVPQTPGAGFTSILMNTPNPGYIAEALAVSSTGTYPITSSWSTPASSACGGGTGNNDSAFGINVPLKGATGSVTLTPTSWPFGSVNVGSSSTAQGFTLTNNSATGMTGLTLAPLTGNTADFPTSGSTCTSTLAASASCAINGAFSPTAAGARTTNLTATYSGGDGAGTQTSLLTGTGSLPTAAVPVGTPAGGTFTGSSALTLTDSSSGAIICFNQTGYIPIGGVGTCPLGSTKYVGTFPITSTSKLYVWAGGVGYADSAAVLYSFQINPINPVGPSLRVLVNNTQTQKVPITNTANLNGVNASLGPVTHTLTIATNCTCTVVVATSVATCSCPQTVTVTN